MSNLKNILQNFQNINFTQYEAKAYLSLLQHDQVSGYELAKNSGIPASKIYQVLNKLLQREIIVALDTDPVKYAPIPPDQVISKYRNDYLHNIDSLKSGLDEIYNQHQHTDNYIWNISGRQAILNRVNEFISAAQNSIHLSVWDEEVTEIRHTLKDAAERDVRLHVVHYGQIKLGYGEEYRHGREHQIRQERGARRIALEVDEQKVILGHFIDDGSSNAAWTTNKGLVLLAKDYIIHDIYTIRIAEKFGEAANQIFESH
jgi:sugar-specific transcriptional regulator TrmB